jgi:type VI secretion system protein ImpF
MAEARARDTLQPALLERLTDPDPTRRVESREERVISRAQLRAAVLRDLSWLFNTTNLTADADLAKYPRVAASTLNYGLTALSGRPVSTLDLPELERVLKEGIERFEPRILPGTLTVRALPSDQLAHHNVISLEITGQLWSHPYPLELLLKTDMDLESGEIRIAESR